MSFDINNFKTLYNSKKGIDKLRQNILNLAIRGKLVEQDGEDEPASELLERIKEEKERLIKEKKIRKPKKLKPIEDDEIPFDIPDNWEWVRVQEISNIYNGNSINAKVKANKYSKVKEGYDYIATKDIGYGDKVIYDTGIKIPIDETKFKIAKKNSILICSEGGSAGKKIAFIEKDICFVNKLLAINLLNETNPKYLFYYISSSEFYRLFSSKMTGIIGGISLTNFRGLPFPLPPLEEQQRIVNKIEELFTIVDRLEQAIEERNITLNELPKGTVDLISNSSNYDELKNNLLFALDNFKNIFQTEESLNELRNLVLQFAIEGKLLPQNKEDKPASELLEEIKAERDKLIKEKKIRKIRGMKKNISEDEKIFEIPNNWEWERLGNILLKLTDGSHHTPKYTKEGIPFISVKDVSSGKIDFSDTRFVSKDTHEELFKRCDPEMGDLLLTKVGTTGIPIIVDTSKEFSLFVSVALLKFNQDLIYNRYLFYLIESPLIKQKSEENTRGVGNKNLVLRDIANFQIPLPPLEEQKRIVKKVESLMDIIDKIENEIKNRDTSLEKLIDVM